mgnify:CR=1 FL=1
MILCCGDALIDMLPVDRPDPVPAWAAHPGGAVFNTAIALGRLGVPVGLMTGLSTDGFGAMLRDALQRGGVDPALSVTSVRKTTLAFVSLDDGQATYSFHDAGSALRMLQPDDLPALPATVGALFFGGISLVGEPCGTAFEAVLHRDAGRRVVMVDPNIRPDFVTDPAAFRARIDRMIARSHIVKLSDEDLVWLDTEGGPDRTMAQQMQAIRARGPSLVIVTRGAAGVSALTGTGTVMEIPARRVPVVDTVGAGDTFNAGLLARLHDLGALSPEALRALPPDALRAALEYGVAASAVVVTRPGAQPPDRSDLPDPIQQAR